MFKKKLRSDGIIDKCMTSLVTMGYTQNECKYFFDTYSPITKLITIHFLPSFAASHGRLIHQMDVNTSFLHIELEKEIYMTQPDGIVVKSQEDKVCNLQKFCMV
jgi:hypothetical protein